MSRARLPVEETIVGGDAAEAQSDGGGDVAEAGLDGHRGIVAGIAARDG
jgi:hypothetical protein